MARRPTITLLLAAVLALPAVAGLKSEVGQVDLRVNQLVAELNRAIAEADKFIAELERAGS